VTYHYLRLVLFTLVIFATALLLIHAQPYDDHELRDLLLPEDCPAPCFMGIRPGVTTEDEAIAIIRASEWIDHDSINILETKAYSNSTLGEPSTLIEWRWTHSANPHLITHENTVDGSVFVRSHFVEKVAIYIHFRLGEIYTSLGSPSKVGFASIRNVTPPWGVAVFHLYTQYGIEFQSNLYSCPYLASLWMPEVRVEMSRVSIMPVIGYRPSAELKQRIQRLQTYCIV
jgi:hypothetical protein